MVKHRTVGRRAALAAGGAALALPTIRARAATNGVALVIGNSKYQWEAALPNVRRDVPEITKSLQALGLQTELVQDAGRDALTKALDKFTAAAQGANLAAFYFAGHGAQWDKDTYLVPVDADLSSPSVVQTLIKVPSIGTALQGAANRLMVFDNCRNTPADGWRQRDAAFSATSRSAFGSTAFPANTLVIYSTAPGRVALDGPAGDTSPFASALVRQLQGPSVDIQSLPAKLRRDLLIATQCRQVAWDQSTLAAPLVLNVSGKTGGVPPLRTDPSRIIELPNAYAFARQNKLPVPQGLVCFRPPSSSPDGAKVGAYSCVLGNIPSLLIVLSVEEQTTAEVILSSYTQEGGGGWGRRFLTSTFTGGHLEMTGAFNKILFTWSDANSGSVTVFSRNKNNISSAKFTRLDG